MNDVSAKITLYQNMFQICLIMTLVCILIAVTVFFVLDIKTTIGYLSGRQAKKKIKELEAETAVSGRLRSEKRKNMEYVAQEMKDDMGVAQKTKMGVRKVAHVVEDTVQGSVQPTHPIESQQVHQESTETSLLPKANDSEKTGNSNVSTGILENGNVNLGKFLIVREIVMIHTEEVI